MHLRQKAGTFRRTHCASRRQGRPNNATQPNTTRPWSRWETPLLIVAVGFTLLLWLLQDVGYHTAWLARIGPWVELVVCLLSLSLLIVYVVGLLSRRKQRRLVPPLTLPDQDDGQIPTPPEDKTFAQAMHDLQRRLVQARSAGIHKRLEQVMGQRIDSLTADIEDPALRADTTEALLKIKLVYLLGLWRKKGHLNQAEYDELENLMMSSRLIPSPERQR